MSVAIMRFKAGTSGYAVAAGCVERVGPARPGVPHLAQLLTGASTTPDAGVRTLQLVSRGQRLDITVDGPVDVVEIAREDITPCPATLGSKVLGFARLSGDMYALLDTESLIEWMNLLYPPLVSSTGP
jgi:hypothetical protein